MTDQAEEELLLPCPFCGGEGIYAHIELPPNQTDRIITAILILAFPALVFLALLQPFQNPNIDWERHENICDIIPEKCR